MSAQQPPKGFLVQYAIELPDGTNFLNPNSGAVTTWSERAGAEHVLAQLQDHARALGFAEYGAQIVYRYCTPFIREDDPGEALVAELESWLRTQGGPS